MARICLEFYEEMHKKHPDALLLFRSGDFYQMFCGDAREGARILGITLAYFRSDPKTATCVFPHHELDTYLPRLIRTGKRVAICDLPEPTPAKKRITELVTPKNNETMKLSINNPETKNVATMPAVINNSAAIAEPIEDAVIVSEESSSTTALLESEAERRNHGKTESRKSVTPKIRKSVNPAKPPKGKKSPQPSSPSPQPSPSYTLVTYTTKKNEDGFGASASRKVIVLDEEEAGCVLSHAYSVDFPLLDGD